MCSDKEQGKTRGEVEIGGVLDGLLNQASRTKLEICHRRALQGGYQDTAVHQFVLPSKYTQSNSRERGAGAGYVASDKYPYTSSFTHDGDTDAVKCTVLTEGVMMDETLEPFGCLTVFTTAGYGWPARDCQGGGSDAGDRGRQGTQLRV